VSADRPIEVEERLGVRPHVSDAYGRDTSVLVTVSKDERRSWRDSRVIQVFLHLTEGWKIRRGNLGRCPHCRRALRMKFIVERVD
jgi:hypothetical protein